MKSQIKKVLSLLKKPLIFLFELECQISRYWASAAHKRLMSAQWSLPPNPENFDHHIDLYYQWLSKRNPLWLERGVFTALTLRGGGTRVSLWRWF